MRSHPSGTGFGNATAGAGEAVGPSVAVVVAVADSVCVGTPEGDGVGVGDGTPTRNATAQSDFAAAATVLPPTFKSQPRVQEWEPAAAAGPTETEASTDEANADTTVAWISGTSKISRAAPARFAPEIVTIPENPGAMKDGESDERTGMGFGTGCVQPCVQTSGWWRASPQKG